MVYVQRAINVPLLGCDTKTHRGVVDKSTVGDAPAAEELAAAPVVPVPPVAQESALCNTPGWVRNTLLSLKTAALSPPAVTAPAPAPVSWIVSHTTRRSRLERFRTGTLA